MGHSVRAVPQFPIEKNERWTMSVTKLVENKSGIETAAEYAPQILKAEWERVKRGELAFRVVRNWVAPLIVVVSLAFVVLAWTGKVKI